MANYVDGFALPIPLDHLSDYRRLSKAVAEIWKEHGALDYREFVANDPDLEGTRSFAEALSAGEGETVVFGWVAFASREARDLANQMVAADPRIPALMSELDTGFDGARMAYGGFEPLI